MRSLRISQLRAVVLPPRAHLQIWIVFLIAVYVSRLGAIKLGKPTDEPEYPTASWFMMMFSAGIGIGLFFFGVAEPVWCAQHCISFEPRLDF